ncbi:MAG: hypothetical protein ACREUF_00925 [Solimonas sp.]
MNVLRAAAALGATLPLALAFQPPVLADAPSPAKPIRLVVSLGAGTGPDSIARRIADKLAPVVGQSVVVENRPGVSGILAADSVVKSRVGRDSFKIRRKASNSLMPNDIQRFRRATISP